MRRTQALPSFMTRLGDRQSGHVAIIFALALIPLLAVAGFAIDFQMTIARKNKVQIVMDSAVLAGAKLMQTTATEEEVRAHVKEYMDAQLDTVGGGLTCGTINIQVDQSTEEVAADVTCKQDTTLMNLVGSDHMPFRVDSASTYGIGKLDVAFMFDVSGSMGDYGRMDDLKAAAFQAVETLMPSAGGPATEDVRIAIVSYDTSVNAGDYFSAVTGLNPTRTYHAEYTQNYTYTWTELVEEQYQDLEETIVEYPCTETVCGNVCVSFRKNGNCRSNGWEYQCNEVETTCTYSEWEEVTKTRLVEQEYSEIRQRQAKPSKTIYNNTCVYERPGDNAFNDIAPTQMSPLSNVYGATEPIYHAGQSGTSSNYTKVEDAGNADNYLAAGYALFTVNSDATGGYWRTYTPSCSEHEPMGLTNIHSEVDSYIFNLDANGRTAGQQGIAWAWYAVAEDWDTVFTGTETPLAYDEPDSTKAIILMTDGSFNEEEFETDLGDSFSQAWAMCDAIKAQNEIYIYTIAFQAPGEDTDLENGIISATSTMEYCASSPDFSFSPDTGDELQDAYQQIATSISDLRISR